MPRVILVLQLLLPTSLVRRRCGRRPIIMLLRAIPMAALLLAALLSVLAAEVPRPINAAIKISRFVKRQGDAVFGGA